MGGTHFWYNNDMSNSIGWECSACGKTAIMEFRICPECGAYGTAVHRESESASVKPSAGMRVNASKKSSYVSNTKAYTVNSLSDEDIPRVSTDISEFDRILDGGILPGQVILIGAEPGFGKSTLALEVLGNLSSQGYNCLYASGEESAHQIAQRARRLHINDDHLRIMSTTIVEDVFSHATDDDAEFVVVDSLQTMASNAVDGTIGGVSQSKEAAISFKQYAKDNDVAFILISQFTKSDEVAGSNQIAHVVDTIFIGDADKETRLKFLRSQKNRYGKTDEVAVFVHEDDGLKSVDDPSEYLIGDMNELIAGSAKTFIQDGNRILPVEINALVADAAYGSPQRQFSGYNTNRGRILIAACSKYVPSCSLGQSDVFVSTISGVQIGDPNADLALAAAVISSAADNQPNTRTAWIGEVALTGKIRGRSLMESKIKEAARLGFERVVIPASAKRSLKTSVDIQIDTIESLGDMVKLI
jgi:DNA repair protein RadA/Sms